MEQNPPGGGAGKTGRYLKYAIGEIILVVIGILIALQINNWNETEKTKKFEYEIINLIDQNLKQDSIAISSELFKAKLAIRLTDSLLMQVSKKDYSDNLNSWMGKIICFERFKSQSSAFEVLKAKGIEVISSNQLQMALISYYDGNLFKLYESLNDVEDSFKIDWVPVIKEDFIDFNWQSSCSPANSSQFFKKQSTIVLFKIFRDNRYGEVEKLTTALNKVTDIRVQIKKHKA